MIHLWLRAEQRPNEKRVPLTHEGARTLINAGVRLSVEESSSRILDTDGYKKAGAFIVPENSWPTAPKNAIVLGVKELPDSTEPLIHRHIMFGHAYKGQPAGAALLKRFSSGQGTLYDLEYLLDKQNRRIAAFGYWAGFAGAAVSIKAWVAQQQQLPCAAVEDYPNKVALIQELRTDLKAVDGPLPKVIIIGALGRVGSGAMSLCQHLGLHVTAWDIDQTRHGGPYPEILQHSIFLNCIVANEGVPPFIPASFLSSSQTSSRASPTEFPRALRVIGDIACDPSSDYNPIPLYNDVTDWDKPVIRVCDEPVLDIMAIDNLPSLLPLESSIDFSSQLLPALLTLDKTNEGVWRKAADIFHKHNG